MNTRSLPLLVNQDERPVPLYEHVKRQISEQILIGAWTPGTVLPNEAALAAQFGVAVGTLRHALSDLTAEGMLSRRRKTGTVVTGRSPQHSLRFFFQYFRLHSADGRMIRSDTEVLELDRVPANEAEARTLGAAPGTMLVRLHRLRRIDGAPVMLDTLLIAAERLPDFPTNPAQVPALLYLHLLEQYGIRITAVRETMKASLSTARDRALLSLPSPSAVLVIEEVAYDQAGNPTILGHHVASTRDHSYVNEIR